MSSFSCIDVVLIFFTMILFLCAKKYKNGLKCLDSVAGEIPAHRLVAIFQKHALSVLHSCCILLPSLWACALSTALPPSSGFHLLCSNALMAASLVFPGEHCDAFI